MGFKGNRTSVSKAGVEPGAVVEGFDVVEDGGARFGEGGEALVVNDFVFETAPEGFDEGVVVAVARATHGSDQAMLGEEIAIRGAGKLAASIGVKDELGGRSALAQGHAQSGDGQRRIQKRAHGPADNAPAMEIEDCDQI